MTTFTGTAGDDVLPSLLEALLALGDDVLFGLGGDDLLVGYTGDDTFEGGSGSDILIGGILDIGVLGAITITLAGNNTASYASSSAGVTIDLSTTVDLIDVPILLTTVDLFDVVVGSGGDAAGDILVGMTNLIGSDFADSLTGNDADNFLSGGAGVDILDGGVGSDVLYGGDGADVVYGGNAFDTLAGDSGDDTLFGGQGQDLLDGDTGDDVLDGGTGLDTMSGGSGNDSYFVDQTTDRAIELPGDGTDIVYASSNYGIGANIEQLTLTGSFNLAGAGNAENNIITGNTGSNNISGGAGNDQMYGGEGNDKIFGDAGFDTMYGGNGNDSFFVDSTADVAVELVGQGYDRVVTTVDYTLAMNIEVLRMLGGDDLVGTGNEGQNLIIGNGGDNTFIGLAGNDALVGIAGGNNRFEGGDGTDWSFGGSGTDTFVFSDDWDSDQIHNMQTGAGGDLVSLELVTNITSFTDLVDNHLTTDRFGNAMVFDGDNAIRFIGIAEAELTSDNFLF